MRIGNLEIKQVQWHRNGIAGAGFYALLFRDLDQEADMVATLFDAPGACAVLRVPDLSDPDKGVTFGTNSWRGDYYEADLREAAETWGGTGRVGPFSMIPALGEVSDADDQS
jgi:hypothetical protein